MNERKRLRKKEKVEDKVNERKGLGKGMKETVVKKEKETMNTGKR